jgi:hypothetical protein
VRLDFDRAAMTVKCSLNTKPGSIPQQRLIAITVCAGVFATALVISSALAVAQDLAQDGGSPNAAKTEEPGFLENIGKWFGRQADNIGSTLGNAGKKVSNFGHEAGVAARTTVEGAKDAADAMVKIPTARVVSGHEKCSEAPNGAPDCVAAATVLCKAKGFASGKSADMTTAEICPAQVYLSGRNSGPGCHTETFVSRALCQ